MNTQHRQTSGVLGLSLATVLGLALLAQPGLAGTANATDQEPTAQTASAAMVAPPTGSQSIKGRFFNIHPTVECRNGDESQVCNYTMKGLSITDEGEPYRHTIVGTSFGRAIAPGDESRHQSYVIWTFDDGSMALMKSRGTTTVHENGQRTVAGTQVCLDGMGRFENADCSIDWSHSGHNDGLNGGVYEGVVTPKAPS